MSKFMPIVSQKMAKEIRTLRRKPEPHCLLEIKTKWDPDFRRDVRAKPTLYSRSA